jgi:hypothetical protein
MSCHENAKKRRFHGWTNPVLITAGLRCRSRLCPHTATATRKFILALGGGVPHVAALVCAHLSCVTHGALALAALATLHALPRPSRRWLTPNTSSRASPQAGSRGFAFGVRNGMQDVSPFAPSGPAVPHAPSVSPCTGMPRADAVRAELAAPAIEAPTEQWS